jgi:hypothetical protein
MGAMRNLFKIVVEGKILLGRPGIKWKDNIKMGLREIWWDSLDGIGLALDSVLWRDVITWLCLRVP